MANMTQMGRDVDALHVKLDAIMEALGIQVSTERQKRIDANEKARRAYMPGGRMYKQIHGNPHGDEIEPETPEGVPTAEDMEDPEFAAGYQAGVAAIVGTPGTIMVDETATVEVGKSPEAEAEAKAEGDEDEPKKGAKPASGANAKK